MNNKEYKIFKALLKLDHLQVAMSNDSQYDRPTYEEVRKEIINILKIFD